MGSSLGSSIIQSSTKITNNTDVYMRKYDEKSLESLHNWSKLTRKENYKLYVITKETISEYLQESK